MRLRFRTVLAVAAVSLPGFAHDDVVLTPQQEVAVQRALAVLRKADGRPSVELVPRVGLDEFSSHELRHLRRDCPGVPDEIQPAFVRICDALLYGRSPVGKLKRAGEISFLLASPDPDDAVRVFRLLIREPVNDDLERAVVNLGRDERPSVRLVAAQMATALLSFGRSEKRLAPTLMAGLVDRDPDVAVACVPLANRTQLLRVYDRMVACLDDDRKDRRGQAVGDRNLSGLRFGIQLEFMSRHAGDVDLEKLAEAGKAHDGAAVLSILAGGWGVPETADEIRTWWRENREQFAFAKPSPPLRVVFDDVIELRLNEAHGIQLRTDERFEVTLTEYTEFVSGGKPFVSVDIDLRTPDDGVYVDVGTGSLPQGVRVWGGSWLGPGRDQIRSEHWEAVVFPTHEPKVFRVRLVGHQAKAKKDRG